MASIPNTRNIRKTSNTVLSANSDAVTPAVRGLAGRPAYQAYLALRIGFAALPIVAGLDKFMRFLADWEMYLAPVVTQVVPVTTNTFMAIVGVIEIAAGLIVAFRPQIGGYIVALWLWGIIINLCLIPGFYDIAMRDFGLSVGALALARLSRNFSRRETDRASVTISRRAAYKKVEVQ